MTLSKKDLLLLSSGVGLFVLLAGLVWYSLFYTKTPELNKDYSKLNQVKPGKTSQEELIKINGKPESTKAEGGKTYFYYKTPLASFKNLVLIENGVVSYALENVYGPYRGTSKDYEKYGQAELTLYEEGEEVFPWHVYLDDGVGVSSDSRGDVLKVLYFIPQDETSFMESVAKDLRLSTEAGHDHETEFIEPTLAP